MAGALKGRVAALCGAVGVCGAWLAPAPAAALGPSQPFTPPAALSPAPASTSAATAVEAGTPSDTAESVPTGLTGVRLGSSPRALIDGQWVALGAPARQGRLVQVRAHEAVLRLPGGALERLAMFPEAPSPAGQAPSAAPSIVKRDLP